MHQQPQHSQQRPTMPSMVGRSQSGGMPIGGDSHYMGNGPHMQQRGASYGGMPPPNQGGMGMNMGGGVYPRMGGDMMGGGNGPHASQMGMGYGQQRAISEPSMSYDTNNFPALHGQPQQLRFPGGGGGSHSAHNVPPSQREEEFTIHNEEFPALPSTQGKGRNDGSSGQEEQQQNTQLHAQQSDNQAGSQHGQQQGQSQYGTPRLAGASPPLPPQASPLQQPQPMKSPQLQASPAGGGGVGIGFGNAMGHVPSSPGLYPAGNTRSSAPGGAPGNPSSRPPSVPVSPRLTGTDSGPSGDAKYGLMGLLDVIKMTDRDLNSLSLGSDLTTFGLNLNSTESLYTTFTGPFADQTSSNEPQFTTPQCYLMHPPSLKPDHLTKFQLETLFYMFYAMPRDILQTTAAVELYRREWRYHGELRVWFKPRSPQEQIQGHPGVQYVYFDMAAWETRLFTSATRAPIAAGFLSDEEIRQKPQSGASHASTSGSTATS